MHPKSNNNKILITGGAGFIGSHLTDALINRNYCVRILDNLDPQVHGTERNPPVYLNHRAEFIRGSVLDRDVLANALEDVQCVFHLAALTGVGQSMYEVSRYSETNMVGTALLLELMSQKHNQIKTFVLASSRAVYGEGKHFCNHCGVTFPSGRFSQKMETGQWELICENCGEWTTPLPTDEESRLQPGSIYAISKQAQEQLALCTGRAYGVPVIALRYFNVFGPRQSLTNPYTGILSNFSTRILNQQTPEVYEDGKESRDFIHVQDIIEANILAMQRADRCQGEIFNVGTGVSTSIYQAALILSKALGVDIKPKITGKFRIGDIRHCFADITKTKNQLEFISTIPFSKGISDLAAWVKGSLREKTDERAEIELVDKGLMHQGIVNNPTCVEMNDI